MGVTLMSLWLPILLSAVFVFIVSSVIHMFLTYHQSDYPKLDAEDAVMDALRPFNLAPGDYAIPRAGSAKEMSNPEFVEKMTKGPVAFLTVLPSGPPKMGANLAQWFGYSILVSLIAAYVASEALPTGAEYLDVFQIAGTTAFGCYAIGLLQNAIWFGRRWSGTLKSVFDGLVYALVTAGTLGWLWP